MQHGNQFKGTYQQAIWLNSKILLLSNMQIQEHRQVFLSGTGKL